ncbi:hypothetical protein FVE85_1570 [Porphyridium purpureum]|uniref:Uncharacterized protein n=1 Tax=Porphyridium purpureum TaxID=35688 RepID=A0A5J4YVW7_PORPP|nr:hypothetical protein FVE85_1570 [Porphyridium purpureum]|eukprot:POR4415..scf209_3
MSTAPRARRGSGGAPRGAGSERARLEERREETARTQRAPHSPAQPRGGPGSMDVLDDAGNTAMGARVQARSAGGTSARESQAACGLADDGRRPRTEGNIDNAAIAARSPIGDRNVASPPRDEAPAQAHSAAKNGGDDEVSAGARAPSPRLTNEQDTVETEARQLHVLPSQLRRAPDQRNTNSPSPQSEAETSKRRAHANSDSAGTHSEGPEEDACKLTRSHSDHERPASQGAEQTASRAARTSISLGADMSDWVHVVAELVDRQNPEVRSTPAQSSNLVERECVPTLFADARPAVSHFRRLDRTESGGAYIGDPDLASAKDSSSDEVSSAQDSLIDSLSSPGRVVSAVHRIERHDLSPLLSQRTKKQSKRRTTSFQSQTWFRADRAADAFMAKASSSSGDQDGRVVASKIDDSQASSSNWNAQHVRDQYTSINEQRELEEPCTLAGGPRPALQAQVGSGVALLSPVDRRSESSSHLGGSSIENQVNAPDPLNSVVRIGSNHPSGSFGLRQDARMVGTNNNLSRCAPGEEIELDSLPTERLVSAFPSRSFRPFQTETWLSGSRPHPQASVCSGEGNPERTANIDVNGADWTCENKSEEIPLYPTWFHGALPPEEGVTQVSTVTANDAPTSSRQQATQGEQGMVGEIVPHHESEGLPPRAAVSLSPADSSSDMLQMNPDNSVADLREMFPEFETFERTLNDYMVELEAVGLSIDREIDFMSNTSLTDLADNLAHAEPSTAVISESDFGSDFSGAAVSNARVNALVKYEQRATRASSLTVSESNSRSCECRECAQTVESQDADTLMARITEGEHIAPVLHPMVSRFDLNAQDGAIRSSALARLAHTRSLEGDVHDIAYRARWDQSPPKKHLLDRGDNRAHRFQSKTYLNDFVIDERRYPRVNSGSTQVLSVSDLSARPAKQAEGSGFPSEKVAYIDFDSKAGQASAATPGKSIPPAGACAGKVSELPREPAVMGYNNYRVGSRIPAYFRSQEHKKSVVPVLIRKEYGDLHGKKRMSRISVLPQPRKVHGLVYDIGADGRLVPSMSEKPVHAISSNGSLIVQSDTLHIHKL